jgi:hypothetical protein
MLWQKSCPRCKGDLYQDGDLYGRYVACFQCSHYLSLAEELTLRIMRLLNLLDGTRTLEEVAAITREHDASLKIEDVYDAVSVLVDAGYVEDAALSPSPDIFSPPGAEGHQRNFELFAKKRFRKLTRATVI